MSAQKKAMPRRALVQLTSARTAARIESQRGRALSQSHRQAISKGMRRSRGGAVMATNVQQERLHDELMTKVRRRGTKAFCASLEAMSLQCGTLSALFQNTEFTDDCKDLVDEINTRITQLRQAVQRG